MTTNQINNLHHVHLEDIDPHLFEKMQGQGREYDEEELNELVLDGHLSDLSENETELFDQDAHLVDYVDYSKELNELHRENETTKILSLDEISFNRDIRKVNDVIKEPQKTIISFPSSSSHAKPKLLSDVKLRQRDPKISKRVDNRKKDIEHENENNKFMGKQLILSKKPSKNDLSGSRSGTTHVSDSNTKSINSPNTTSSVPISSNQYYRRDSTKQNSKAQSSGRRNRTVRNGANYQGKDLAFQHQYPYPYDPYYEYAQGYDYDYSNEGVVTRGLESMSVVDNSKVTESHLRVDAKEFVPFNCNR